MSRLSGRDRRGCWPPNQSTYPLVLVHTFKGVLWERVLPVPQLRHHGAQQLGMGWTEQEVGSEWRSLHTEVPSALGSGWVEPSQARVGPLPALPWFPEPRSPTLISFRILEDLPIKLSN